MSLKINKNLLKMRLIYLSVRLDSIQLSLELNEDYSVSDYLEIASSICKTRVATFESYIDTKKWNSKYL
jgi:hypothetical protein